jgi:hypothetical protein
VTTTSISSEPLASNKSAVLEILVDYSLKNNNNF